MPAPVLATKLYIPPLRPNAVSRPRLIERLNGGLRGTPGVTLISAPAGFGKTTLVSEWVAGFSHQREPQVSQPAVRATAAWLSLDEGDNDLNNFLTYFVTALQNIAPEIGAGVLAALQSPQPPPIESLLTTLINEIAAKGGAIPVNFVLVLDDYHVIVSRPVGEALTFLLKHLPSQMHLVIASREDPHLPLARFRALGQLTELRSADLRFTPAEAAEFLNRVMGLNLSAEDINALETRTEGWIAGLQLAALALQGLSTQHRQDTASFIQSFTDSRGTGFHRFVLDYLVEEVLQRQPADVRDFLLRTSILDRLCGSLCSAVCSYGTPASPGGTASSRGSAITQQEDGAAMLEALERGNLFVIPLADVANEDGAAGFHWYRYHHLFAEVLRTYLDREYPGQAPTFHRLASAWFEQNDLPAEAIRHALAAKDFERAARLIEKVWLAMDLSYQSAVWLGWVKALPDELIRNRPVVSLGYAWALLNCGELETSEARLRDAERWLEPAAQQGERSSAGMVVVDEGEFRSLPASIAAARAYRALALGDIPGTKKYARQALALVSENDTVRRTQATALLGMAEYASGDLPAAEQEFLKFQALMWQANDIANAIGITFILANILLIQGRLQEAVSAYRKSLKLAAKHGAPSFLGASDLYRGLSEVLCEQGDLEGAEQHLRTAQQVGEQGVLTGWPHRLCAAQARLKEAQGDLAGALALLDEAERQYVRNPLPDRPIAALKARVWARQGRLTEALAWVREQNLSPDDELSYLREFEHLTLARVLIACFKSGRAEGDLQAALGLLARLLEAAEAGGRAGSVIEILIVQSLARQAPLALQAPIEYQTQGDQPLALAALERALALAEPEGYVRIFVDEGEPMRLLIEKQTLKRAHPLNSYAAKLLAAFAQPAAIGPGSIREPEVQAAKIALLDPEDRRAKTMLVDPLSDRELEVLRLLRSELSGPEIAQQLIISLNTLRTHTKNIFTKLEVNNRRAAIRRAEELGLF